MMNRGTDGLQIIGTSMLDDVRAARRRDASNIFQAPRTPVQATLCEICAGVLGLERVGIQDNFFELGGNSLEATQLVSRIRHLFGVELPLGELFQEPTIEAVATYLENAIQEPSWRKNPLPPLKPIARAGPLPLSFAQERMWFIHQLDPHGVAYHIVITLGLEGKLDIDALRASFNEVVRRHEALRTVFPSAQGQPVQIIQPPFELPLPYIDLRAVSLETRRARAFELSQQEIERPFDLAAGPLFRLTLYQLGDDESILLVLMHHIISDAWSLSVMLQEAATLYNARVKGEPLLLSELPIQAVDFAAWQREWMQGDILQEELAYWRKQLDGVPALELPTDHPRPPVQTYRGAHQYMTLSQSLFDALQALSLHEGVTFSMILLAAFKTLLYRYAAQTDIAVGMSIANRRWVAVEGLISAFVNTLVLRTDLSGDPTFQELLSRERQVALEAYAHQDMPFAKLVAELNPERRINQSPLVQVMFNFINLPPPQVTLHGLAIELIPLDHGGAQFDLTLAGTDMLALRRLTLEYNTDLFDHATAARMLRQLVNLLQAIVRNPKERISRLALLSRAEERELLVEWNATGQAYPPKCVHELFEAQVERTPDRIALRFGAAQLSYRALNARANQLAHRLRALGVAPETFVGICAERTPEMIIALLGVLKAGGAFVPLNPGFPKERLAFMLAETRAPVIVTQQQFVQTLPGYDGHILCLDPGREKFADASGENLSPVARLDNAAYVLFTSGSTGTPKGVIGLHRGIVNDLHWQWRTYPFEPNENCALRTPLNFIDSLREIFAPLLQGVTGVLVPEEAVQDQRRLVQMLAQGEVTRSALTPSLLRALLEMEPRIEHALPNCKYWFVGGEALPAELCHQFLARMPGRVLVNLYGCSEAAGDSTYFDTRDLGAREFVPIGRPLANTCVFILDAHRQPVPIGVPGELYLGGDGLARGYLNHPEWTTERFVASPFATGARLFKTGDLACWLPDGNVKYLGRSDMQIKVRGIRVEVGEVETVLRQHPAIAEVAIVPRQDASQNQQLVAYLVPKANALIQPGTLRHFLQERVPHYMIPAAFVTLDALPLNASGKVDRRALPFSEPAPAAGAFIVAPQDALERQLQTIWERVLKVQPIGVHDDFFELGGHSLLAVRLFAEMERELGEQLPMSALFQAPTIDGLAAKLRRNGASAWSPLVPIQPDGSRTPFFCVHGLGGGVVDYTRLARLLGPTQPFYGLQAYGMQAGQTPDAQIEAMATRFIRGIQQVQPGGPYALGGYSYGGTVAYEMARQLCAQGQTVALLAMFDHPAPNSNYARVQLNARFVQGFVQNLPYWVSDYWQLDALNKWGRIVQRFRRARSSNGEAGTLDLAEILDDISHIPAERRALMQVHLNALQNYVPQPYAGCVTLFRTPRQPLFCSYDPHLGWDALALGGVELYPIAGFHRNLLQEPHVQVLASQLKARLCFLP